MGLEKVVAKGFCPSPAAPPRQTLVPDCPPLSSLLSKCAGLFLLLLLHCPAGGGPRRAFCPSILEFLCLWVCVSIACLSLSLSSSPFSIPLLPFSVSLRFPLPPNAPALPLPPLWLLLLASGLWGPALCLPSPGVLRKVLPLFPLCPAGVSIYTPGLWSEQSPQQVPALLQLAVPKLWSSHPG